MIYDNRKNRKGFTLIELLVVILIVGILSAVAIPYMRGRTDASKWAEGKAMAGSIRTAIRAYYSEKGPGFDYSTATASDLGFAPGDLDGKYFKDADFTFSITNTDPLEYTITIATNKTTSPEAPDVPASLQLDQTGEFTVP